MSLPDRFMFYYHTDPNFFYSATYEDNDIDGSRFHIEWSEKDSHGEVGSATYSYDDVENAVNKGTWVIINFETNKNALSLLQEEEF